jgi:hypothetical protein
VDFFNKWVMDKFDRKKWVWKVIMTYEWTVQARDRISRPFLIFHWTNFCIISSYVCSLALCVFIDSSNFLNFHLTLFELQWKKMILVHHNFWIWILSNYFLMFSLQFINLMVDKWKRCFFFLSSQVFFFNLSTTRLTIREKTWK